MVGRHLLGQEPGQGGIGLEAACPPRRLRHGREHPRHPGGDLPPHRGNAVQLENPRDPAPQRHRRALADEIRPSPRRRPLIERGGREHVGSDTVVDEGQIDEVRAVADLHEAAGPGAAEDRRNEVRVTGAEDEMRPQRDRTQIGAVGREHGLLRGRLRLGVEGLKVRRIGLRFIDTAEAGRGGHHARRGGEDEPRHPGLTAGGDDVAGRHHVAGPEGFLRPPHLHVGRGVEHASHTGEVLREGRIGRGGGEIVGHHPDPLGSEARGWAPREGDHVCAKSMKAAAECRSDEAASARDEHPHAIPALPAEGGARSTAVCVAAQTESLSRKILALCRASTGNDGWK